MSVSKLDRYRKVLQCFAKSSKGWKLFGFLPLILMVSSPWSVSWGCDICAVYNSILSSRGNRGSFNAGVAQQFTSLSSGVGGEKQYLESSITQPFLNYYFTDQLSFQANFPLIYRNTRRIVDTEIELRDVSGLGDIPLLLKYQALTTFDSDSSVIWEVFGGLKLPSGSTEQLRDVSQSHHGEGPVDDENPSTGDAGIGELPNRRGDHSHAGTHSHVDESPLHRLGYRTPRPFIKDAGEIHGEGELVSGHDLSLGSGSYDWIGGTSLFAVSGRNYFNGLLQYNIRQEGDYGFKYGNDLQWHAGPGRYLLFEHDRTVGFRARLSGEWKQDDALAGSRLNGSDFYRVFVGPELIATFGNKTFCSLGSDFLVGSNSAREGLLPHTRFSLVLSHRF